MYCKIVRVISTLPGLAQLHLFSDLQYYIYIIIITPPATEAYIMKGTKVLTLGAGR